ncbi:hypothetical protein CTI16_09575 [Prevotella intermedia]|uniref:Uncharacterized protein n=1 Tax=Prevotella intermedia TaxID=28131 RepID=A0AAJ3RIB1_PREIN|nr:hypothetical protein BWX40_10230 [Prevotella intermedia]PIK17256.1 hypothetical protein CTI16_09575 [Prevotella intermedia]
MVFLPPMRLGFCCLKYNGLHAPRHKKWVSETLLGITTFGYLFYIIVIIPANKYLKVGKTVDFLQK